MTYLQKTFGVILMSIGAAFTSATVKDVSGETAVVSNADFNAVLERLQDEVTAMNELNANLRDELADVRGKLKEATELIAAYNYRPEIKFIPPFTQPKKRTPTKQVATKQAAEFCRDGNCGPSRVAAVRRVAAAPARRVFRGWRR